MERSLGGDAVFPVRHVAVVEIESAPLADLVPAKLCGSRRTGPCGYHSLPALEPVGRATSQFGRRPPARTFGQFLTIPSRLAVRQQPGPTLQGQSPCAQETRKRVGRSFTRRQLDFELDANGTCILENLNRLAGTRQKTRPVHKTLNYFLGRIGHQALADLCTRLVRCLLRMRVLDAARLQGHWVVAIDGTGYLTFRQRHCAHCLERHYGEVTLYLHQVLEAKLLGPEGLVVSLGTVFIDQSDTADTPADADAERRKQDCELKAFNRLDKQLGHVSTIIHLL